MLGGADNSNGELQSYIIGANTWSWTALNILIMSRLSQMSLKSPIPSE